MRIATYLGLVLRRIWARKLMLLGSFLGATLVTALLVVLPLYESSVAAIDLLFTFRQAPDTTVNLSAVQTTTEYSAGTAEAAREVTRRIGEIYQLEKQHQAAIVVLAPSGDWSSAALRPGYSTTVRTPAGAEQVEAHHVLLPGNP